MNSDETQLKVKLHLPQDDTDKKSPPHVLLAEDDSDMRVLLVRAFLREGYRVTECYHGLDLLDRLETLVLYSGYVIPEHREHYDLVVSAIRMAGTSALETIGGLQKHGGIPPVILITAFGDNETLKRACELGVAAVFDKPFELDDLLAKARELAPLLQSMEEQANVID